MLSLFSFKSVGEKEKEPVSLHKRRLKKEMLSETFFITKRTPLRLNTSYAHLLERKTASLL